MNARRSVLSLAALAVLVVPASAAFSQPVPFDHLKCERVLDPLKLKAKADLLALQDEFSARGCVIEKPELFCVPVAKLNVRPRPPRPDITGQPLKQDYICYRARCPDKRKRRVVSDQFGTRKEVMFQTSLLCVPAVKGEVPTTTTTTTTTSSTTTTLPPPPCSLDPTSPQPVCAGGCPDPALVCAAIPGDGCECVPPDRVCGIDAAGICSGLCPSPLDICDVSQDTNECKCLRPIPCKESLWPTCGGLCPPGTRCEPILGANACDCLPPSDTCTLRPDGLCGGPCPAPLVCGVIPGTNECGCVDRTVPCEASDPPGCGGSCPAGSTCKVLETETGLGCGCQ